MAKYELSNGLHFNTEPELDAYIRCLEMVRHEGDLSDEQSEKFAGWLDNAHSTKSIAHLAEKSDKKD